MYYIGVPFPLRNGFLSLPSYNLKLQSQPLKRAFLMFFKDESTDELLRELSKPMFRKLDWIFDYIASRYNTKQVKAKLVESYLVDDGMIAIELDITIDRWDRLDIVVIMDCQYTLRIIHCQLEDRCSYGNPRKVCPMDNPRSNCPETVLSPYRLFRLIEEFRQNGTDYFWQYGRDCDYEAMRFYIEV